MDIIRPVRARAYNRVPLHGFAAADSVTPQQIAERFADTERALLSLRQSIIKNQDALKRAGTLTSSIEEFNKTRSQYAQVLTRYTEEIRSQLDSLDKLQGDLSFGLWRGSRVEKFNSELRARTGGVDPGLSLIDTMPPIKPSGGRLAGLGALPAAAIVALAVGAAALAVGVAIKLSGITAFAAASSIEEQARREQQKIDAIVACKGDEKCLASLTQIDVNKPPPTSGFPWGLTALVGGAAALWYFWPVIAAKVLKSRA